MINPTSPTPIFRGMDIWNAWMENMVAAERICSCLNPFEAQRVLVEAASIGYHRLSNDDQVEYYLWLNSLAKIVFNRCNKGDCYLSGLQHLCTAFTYQWVMKVMDYQASVIVSYSR